MERITDSINRLPSEISCQSYCDDELTKSTVKKEDLETEVETHSSKHETAVPKTNATESEVVEFSVTATESERDARR